MPVFSLHIKKIVHVLILLIVREKNSQVSERLRMSSRKLPSSGSQRKNVDPQSGLVALRAKMASVFSS